MGIPLYNSSWIETAVIIAAFIAWRVFLMLLAIAIIYLALVAIGSVSEWINYWAPLGGPICRDGRCGGYR